MTFHMGLQAAFNLRIFKVQPCQSQPCRGPRQQKLVLLCRALVKCPRLLLLDEPTHGLSGENRLMILNALRTGVVRS